MKPITRKELYLNKIVGNDDYDIPEKPITTEEFFFAEILGEAVQAPEPLTRYQIYLAKIAGREIEIPYPETRLELFLAKACGMDIETPTPITREEIFWSNYTAIVEFELEGVPPLTYKAIEGTLTDYRIYGQTVDGESVGDRTGNLFDEPYDEVRTMRYIPIKVENGEYTLSTTIPNAGAPGGQPAANIFLLAGNVSSGASSTGNGCWLNNPKTVQSVDGYVTIGYKAEESFGEQCNPWNNKIMLNAGSTPLPYEPYGYKVPISVTNSGTTSNETIYLPEQIRKVGDEAEYIDYGEQKQHRVRKNLLQPKVPSMTIYEARFTVNADGSITCDTNGQILSGNTFFSIDDEFIISSPCILSGCPQNGGYNKYRLYAVTLSQPTEYAFDDGDGAVINFEDNIIAVRIVLYAGQIYNNLTFYPMIRNADITDDTYEPYIENTDLDVTLPALPTLTGTNVLSVGTTVQPSKVYVKYKGERQ